jgi:hypothetical protein
MAGIVIAAATTLTPTFATIGSAAALLGSWTENRSQGNLVVRLKHVKHASQVGGYPVVRLRWQTYNAAGELVTMHDPILDSAITVTAGVAAITAARGEWTIEPLKDSDGTIEYPMMVIAPSRATHVIVQAKQAGDTINLGTLAAELDGRI